MFGAHKTPSETNICVFRKNTIISVPRYSELEMERALVGLDWMVLSNISTPVVAGDDRYTAMIRSLLFLADSCDEQGEIWELDLEVVDQNIWAWVNNQRNRPKFVEEEALASLTAFVMRYESIQSQERFQEEILHHGVPLFRLNCIDCSRLGPCRWVPVWGRRQGQNYN